MRGLLRAIVALAVIGAPALWFPTIEVDAAVRSGTSVDLARINDNDPEELCNSDNPRKQKKCKYNGWANGNWRDLDNDNDDDNVAEPVAPVPATVVAATETGLSVQLTGSNEAPDPNTPLTISVVGDGAPIARVSWWSTGPTADNPTGDDMAHFGEQGFDCTGMQPCASEWTVYPRHDGYYSVYARVQDTSGQVVETVWRFTAGEPPL